MVKVDILVNGEKVDALSPLVHREFARRPRLSPEEAGHRLWHAVPPSGGLSNYLPAK